MIIYLYKKTHNKTGLQYLGVTKSTDPHRYPGSGVYWTRHLAVHGSDYTTEILKECTSKEEVREWGLYYTNLWNVVESKEWANLKEECGDGGRQSEEVRKRIGEAGKGRTPWNKGKQIWDEEARKRISEANLARPPQTAEFIANRVQKNTGQKRTNEQKETMSAAQKGRIISDAHKQKIGAANKGNKWWNNGISQRMSVDQPGPDYVLGRSFIKSTVK